MAHGSEGIVNSEWHVEDDGLLFDSDDYGFKVRLEDIVLLGELATPDGPAVDDYFLVLFTRDGARHHASFYADGREAALAALSNYWRTPITLRLSASDALASNILWPASHAGQALFEFRRQAAASFMGRVRERMGFVAIEQELSPAAQECLTQSTTLRTSSSSMPDLTAALRNAHDGS